VGVLASSAARNPPFGATLAAVVGPTSLPASVAIALCALALLTDRLAAPHRLLPRVLASLAVGGAFLAVLGHVLRATPLYRPLPLDASFTLLGAVAVLALGSGCLALRAPSVLPVLSPTIGGTQMRWSLLAAVVVPALMGALALQIHAVYPYAAVSIALMAAG